METDQRIFIGSNGRRIRVTLAPRERRAAPGIEQEVQTIIFETADRGEWVGSSPVFGDCRLWNLTGEEVKLHYLLARQSEGMRD